MICPRCKTKYYARPHCPKCGLQAFTLNKGRMPPSTTGYRSIYVISIFLFFIIIFIAVLYLKYISKKESPPKEVYQKYTFIKIQGESKTNKESNEPAPAPVKKVEEVIINSESAKLNSDGIEAYNKGDYDKALLNFSQAYQRDSSSEVIKRNLYNTLVAKGGIELNQNRYDDAISNFKNGLAYINDDYSAYSGLGMVYLKLEDYNNALTNFLAAYDLNQNNDDIKLVIAKIYYELGDYKNSKKFIELIEDKEKYYKDIQAYSKMTDKNIADVEGKAESKSSHFTVYYDGYNDPVVGNLVSIILEEVYFGVGRELDYYPTEKVTAILYTQQQFDENMQIPKWAGAIFDGKIRLPSGGIKSRSDKLKEVLTHEYTHAVIFSKVGKNCPTWLNEGLAQILSGINEPSKDAATVIINNNKTPSLSTLQRNFLEMSDEDAYISYIFSYFFTQHIIKKFGMNSANRFLDGLSEGEDMDTAFKEAFYSNSNEIYEDFVAELK